MVELPKKIAQTLAAERDRFVLWLPVLLGLGIGIYFTWPVEPGWMGPALALMGSVGFAALFRRYLLLRVIATAASFIALGFLIAVLRTQAVAAPVLYNELYFSTIQGRIDDIQIREKGEKLILTDLAIAEMAASDTPARLSVSLRQEAPGLQIGDDIELRALLFPPPSPAMPGANDFARQFYYDRLGAVGYSPQEPEVIKHADKHSAEEWLNDLRLHLAERIEAPMNKENGPVASALMVGEMSDVPKDVGNAMRDAGLYHVLSISGLHMSLAVGLLYVTIRFLFSLYPPLALRLPVKKIAAGIGLLGALAYLMLAGYPVPAVRSFVMVACMLIAVLFDRRGISVYSLAWAAMLILLFQPEALLGVSFQLSFAATLAILALYERYAYVFHKSSAGIIHKTWLYFFGLMITSLVATLATTPLIIYQFNRFTVLGIAANMLMIPLASFWIMPAAVLAFLAMPLGLEHLPLVWLDHGIALMIAASRWFAALPYANIAVPPPSFAGLLLVIFGGLWLCLWRQRWRLLGIPAMMLGMATIALHQPYDLLVSDDGKKVALRLEDSKYVFLRGKPTSYDAQVWLRNSGQENGLTIKEAGDLPQVECDKQRCVAERAGRHIVVSKRNKAVDGLCDAKADIVIVPYALESGECADIPLRIDRNYLHASGALGFRFGQEVQIDTVASHRGQRPWNSLAHSALVPASNPDMIPENEP